MARKLNRRAFLGTLLFLVVSAALAIANRVQPIALGAPAFWTGWLLAGLLLFLSAFNVRKRIPVLPLGRAAAWTRVHVWVGALGILVFGLHVGFRIPDGALEAGLAIAFCFVALSGVVGLALSRMVPARLALHGEAVLFERIPALRAELCTEVDDLVASVAEKQEVDVVTRFHEERLIPFFARPRGLLLHVLGLDRAGRDLLAEAHALERYATDAERSVLEQIRERIDLKRSLDAQQGLQSVLRVWLFVHVPFTFVLLALAAVHVLAVTSFSRAGG